MREKKIKRPKRGLSCKILSLVLCVCLVVPMLALTGCEQNIDEMKKTTVDYNHTGEYTVRLKESDFLSYSQKEDTHEVEVKEDVKKSDVNFSDIKQDDILVDYYCPIIGDESATENLGEAPDNNNLSKYFQSAEITGFENNGSEIVLSFRDKYAEDNLTDGYIIHVDKYNIFVNVEVLFPVNDLSSNTTEVSSESTENTITITSSGSDFSPNITANDIAFDYSFRDMKVESLSVDGKNLTMKIVGTPVLDLEISPAYTDGIIIVKASGFEKAIFDEDVSFDIKLPVYDVDTEGITGGNGVYNVPINVSGVDVSNIKAEDISFGENTSVEKVTLKDGKIIAEVKTDNMDEIGGVVNIKGTEFLCDYSHASFIMYPYSTTEDAEGFEFVIGLWTYAGSFPEDIEASDFELLDGFENGSITNLDYVDKSEVVLTIKVPSNGESFDDLDIIGTIMVKDGVMKEDWGDPAPAFAGSGDFRSDSYEVVDLKKYNLSSLAYGIDIASLLGPSVAYAAEPENPNDSIFIQDNNNNNNNNNDNNNNNNNNNNDNNNNNGNNNNNNEKPNLTKEDVKDASKEAIKETTKRKNYLDAIDKSVNYTVDKVKKINEGAGKVAEVLRIVYNFGKGAYTGNPVDIVTGTINLIELITAENEGVNPYAIKSLDDKVDEMLALNKVMDAKLDKVIKNQYKGMIQGYENALDALKTDCYRAEAMLRTANEMYVKGGGKVPTKDSNVEEVKAYNKALVDIMTDGEKNGNGAFKDYTHLMRTIETNYKLVTTETYKSWDKNPIFYYDSLWSEYYNYDSQSYAQRVSYRTNVSFQIARSYAALSLYYQIPANPQYADLTKRMEQSMDTLKAHPATAEPPKTEDELKKNPIYSPTLKKSVEGFEYYSDGLGFNPYSGNKVDTNRNGKYNYNDVEVALYKDRIRENGKDRIWKDLIAAFPYMKDKKVSIPKLISTNPMRIGNVDTPIRGTTHGLKMGGAWGSSGFKCWYYANLDNDVKYLTRVPIYYTKFINWDGATMNSKTWTAENGSQGYNSGVQFKFK